ncbi:hypothetical protein [Bifidobacterium sp. ESL0745]|uniref:hypothetical protein n=1 Tax=Bifidobacterium sp. ESL0745 TaxID=2983226 RepID=UPI0023F718A4|nr:hypothetical protein [Bifidobacterium sp. ESL0745]MDF7664977.1 hypothetical protein [Bifidobacterium sp. ESL0745]
MNEDNCSRDEDKKDAQDRENKQNMTRKRTIFLPLLLVLVGLLVMLTSGYLTSVAIRIFFVVLMLADVGVMAALAASDHK